MASVTKRISEIKQPYGGYLPIKLFNVETFDDGQILYETENIHASLVGMAVDYLTRFMLGESANKAFHISLMGASNIGMTDEANILLSYIKGLDENSITAACKLAGFDVCYRNPSYPHKSKDTINPDFPTIDNIRTMVMRSIAFFQKYGPIVVSEPSFEGGYTEIVTTGDGDFVTADTLWDFKVTKSSPTSKHTLQILMYYIMGTHSIHNYYENISNVGIFNPRLNKVYICPLDRISKETITDVGNNVIGYGYLKQQLKNQNQSSQSGNNVYSVSELCEISGLNKNTIYAEIRSGRLNAHKKGNKYYVEQDDFVDYMKQIKLQQKIITTISIIGGLILIAWVLYFMLIKQSDFLL